MGKSSRRRANASAQPFEGEVPVVGMREPCPCGSGKRYKLCHGRARHDAEVAFVARPFEGLAGECDLVAMREVVPAATAKVKVTAEHGGGEVLLASVLPMVWAGLHRADGAMFVGMQVGSHSGDISRDLAGSLLAVLGSEPGTPLPTPPLSASNPRLQDVLDPAEPFEVHVHDGFGFWMGAEDSEDPEVQESLRKANEAAIPTERLTGVDAAYWCRIGSKEHLRWVLPDDEDVALDAIARLHARGESGLGEGTRYIGAFRAHGLLVPVWDLLPGDTADAIEEPAAAWGKRFAEAKAIDAPLTAEERRARAGVVSRQLTLR